MSPQPWAYVFHLSVPPIASVDPGGVSVNYDAGTDSLFSELRPLQGPAISCWINRFEYLRIEIRSREPVGTHIEDFTSSAAFQTNRYLELAAICKDLFTPHGPSDSMLTPEFKRRIVHRAVGLATRSYDRRHGIGAARSSTPNWLRRELLGSEEITRYQLGPENHEFAPPLPNDWVVSEFSNALDRIAVQPQHDRERDFDRMLQYWSNQPGGPTKLETGQILLQFLQRSNIGQLEVTGIREPREEFLMRSIKAG